MNHREIKQATGLSINESYEGIPIEREIERVINNGEPIEKISQMIFTDRKDGVQAQYDIRTDRFEIAQEAMGAVDKSIKAKREQRMKLDIEPKVTIQETTKSDQ